MRDELFDIQMGRRVFDSSRANANRSFKMPEKTERLASIVHRKTNGNVFFVIQFLLALNLHDLLSFDFASMGWKWDEEQVESWTAATANVVDLMQEKLKTLEDKVSRKLPIAAFLGGNFQNRFLSLVLENFDPSGEFSVHFSDEPIQEEEINMRKSSTAAIEMIKFLETCTLGTNHNVWILFIRYINSISEWVCHTFYLLRPVFTSIFGKPYSITTGF